ncbi:hypothetical protein Taro_021177 [Colocasia esculenta]|uniref:Uncharacterized protein n=1 Tax=Colocasia esculenta TaxID=4460 RepID=A0A843V7F5_COLES|nr:hypothetical protein [Colocasia esculenta]
MPGSMVRPWRKDLLIFMHVIVIKKQSRRVCMMKLRGEGKWLRTLWRDIHIIVSVGQPISRQGKALSDLQNMQVVQVRTD